MISETCPTCGNGVTVRTRHVDLLTCPRCEQEFLAAGADGIPMPSFWPDAGTGSSIPLTLEFRTRYSIGALLGRGSSGVVFSAVQRSVDRKVALKFLRRLDNEEAVARFLKEARLLAALNHPSLVHVYEMDEVEGHPYIVMELVDGRSLRTRMSDGALSLPLACRIAGSCLAALDACHARGIVHRDLKPENILLPKRGDARVVDLGIARELESSARLTRAGAVVGTPAYMSPEQLLGERATPASDVYTVGLILYEMLTGERVFGDLPVEQRLRRQRGGEFVPLLKRAPHTPHALARLVERALSPDPAQRPASAAEFLAGLGKDALPGDPSRTLDDGPANARYRTRPGVGRRRTTAAPVVVVLGLGLAIVTAFYPRQPHVRPVAGPPEQQPSRAASTTDPPGELSISNHWSLKADALQRLRAGGAMATEQMQTLRDRTGARLQRPAEWIKVVEIALWLRGTAPEPILDLKLLDGIDPDVFFANAHAHSRMLVRQNYGHVEGMGFTPHRLGPALELIVTSPLDSLSWFLLAEFLMVDQALMAAERAANRSLDLLEMASHLNWVRKPNFVSNRLPWRVHCQLLLRSTPGRFEREFPQSLIRWSRSGNPSALLALQELVERGPELAPRLQPFVRQLEAASANARH